MTKAQESRASADATTKTSGGEVRTALEVALKSSHLKAHLGVAALVQHGASLMNRCVRDFLPPWTPAEIQDAKPRDARQHLFSKTLIFQWCADRFIFLAVTATIPRTKLVPFKRTMLFVDGTGTILPKRWGSSYL